MTLKEHRESKYAWIVALVAACLVFAVMQGIRDNYGIMLDGLILHTDISYENISFAIAVGQLLYGLCQPFFGMLALRKSNAFVMLTGVLLMAAGLIATPFCTGFSSQSAFCWCQRLWPSALRRRPCWE